METVGSFYRYFVDRLNVFYDGDEARSVATIAFENVLGLQRVDLTLKENNIVSDNDQKELNSMLTELGSGRPIQYLTNESWFYGLKLYVDENVLIPRRETEELVGLIVNETVKRPEVIIDYCTGSGCLALALKKAFPSSTVIGVDVSPGALEIAERNAFNNKLDVSFMQMNVLEDNFPKQKAGLIVSNPPYVLKSEIDSMPDRVKNFEPSLALFVPNDDPLLFYRAISTWHRKHSIRNSSIYYEINEKMGKEISELHSQLGYYDYTVRNDLQGKDRFFKAIVP